jgi:hypothetical protein
MFEDNPTCNNATFPGMMCPEPQQSNISTVIIAILFCLMLIVFSVFALYKYTHKRYDRNAVKITCQSKKLRESNISETSSDPHDSFPVIRDSFLNTNNRSLTSLLSGASFIRTMSVKGNNRVSVGVLPGSNMPPSDNTQD